jgi:pyruvate dehydrogenase E1 component
MPKDAQVGILRGMHRVRDAKNARVRLLGAGTILLEALAAAEILAKEGIAAEVYSVTSFTELRRRPDWIEVMLPKTGVPVVAASDYVAAVGDLIRPWIADRYVALGTDGFGRSDTRENLRKFFGVDREAIAAAARAIA